jgi:hypothetical protein
MRVLVSHDYVAPREWRWQAMTEPYDLGVPVGSGATPLQAIEDLLWRLDDETTVPEQVTIEWVD